MGSNAKIEVKAVVSLVAICFEPVDFPTIDECEYIPTDEEYYASLPSMVGYISDGRCSMWDIAKKYNTTCDAIRSGNEKAERLSDSDVVPCGTRLLLIKRACRSRNKQEYKPDKICMHISKCVAYFIWLYSLLY